MSFKIKNIVKGLYLNWVEKLKVDEQNLDSTGNPRGKKVSRLFMKVFFEGEAPFLCLFCTN